jgi:hypothetical protein
VHNDHTVEINHLWCDPLSANFDGNYLLCLNYNYCGLKYTILHSFILLLFSRINNVRAAMVFYKSNCTIANQSNMKGVSPHISDYGFEIVIDLRMEASMSNVVQEG